MDKIEQYRRQSAEAWHDMVLNWPIWQRHNATDPEQRFKQTTHSQERQQIAAEIVLDLARQHTKHTPLGHGCVQCEAMRTLIDFIAPVPKTE